MGPAKVIKIQGGRARSVRKRTFLSKYSETWAVVLRGIWDVSWEGVRGNRKDRESSTNGRTRAASSHGYGPIPFPRCESSSSDLRPRVRWIWNFLSRRILPDKRDEAKKFLKTVRVEEKIDSYSNGDLDHAVDAIVLPWELSGEPELVVRSKTPPDAVGRVRPPTSSISQY